MKKIVRGALKFALVLLFAAVAAYLAAWWLEGGVSNRDLKNCVDDGTKSVCERIDVRSAALQAAVADGSAAVSGRVEERSDAIEARLSRIEEKLDALISAATPRLPDGMQEAR